MTLAQRLQDHQAQPVLAARIFDALRRAGKNAESFTRDDIATLEDGYIRGREATLELARLARLKMGMRVLDLDAGLGSTARTLAAEYGCHVVGLDTSEEYWRTAEMLSERTGYADKVRFRQSDLRELPYPDESFDVVWSQQAQMRVKDKTKLYTQVRRVLRLYGRFALYEICAGPEAPVMLPAPWADDDEDNALLTPRELGQRIVMAGFKAIAFTNVTDEAILWYRAYMKSMDDAPPVGLNLLMGAATRDKLHNLGRNLLEERITVIQAAFVAV